jgi:hypothetical protein
MGVGIPFQVVNLRNGLLARLPASIRVWVGQQAQQIARAGRCGPLQDLQLNDAIRQKFSQSPTPGRAELMALRAVLRFLVLNDAQLANVDLQDILQKQQQALQMLSNISKVLEETAMSIIRKIGG